MAQDSDQPHQKAEQRQWVCIVMFIATGTACSYILDLWSMVCAGCRYSVAIMMDTEGSEVHLNELKQPQKAEVHPVCVKYMS